VKLLDFGVAMSAVTEHAETMIVGKWLYMSPETTTSQQVDHRSDLFSLGVILYLLCSGYLPFTGREPKAIVRKIRAGQYKPLQELASVPDRLVALVNRLLAPNPDDRPQRGQDVAAELADIARQYGLTGSAPGISYVLSRLFSSEMAGGFDQVQVSTASLGGYDSKPTSSLPSSVPASLPSSLASSPHTMHGTPPGSAPIDLPPVPASRGHELSRPVVPPPPGMLVPRPPLAPPLPLRGLVPPAHGPVRSSSSAMKLLVTIAVAILLAVGMYMLVRPS
jgi:serine/threonine protein kinase